MKQVLHIFRKDVRHLWPSIAIVLALTIAHALFDVMSWPVYLPETARANEISSLVNILLPLALWFLIAQAIFQEAIPGDRQFWLTRPYRWTNLLAAKILFVIVFGSVPLFFSDCCILGVQGLGVLSVMPSLLVRQLLLAALFVVPSFALAAVTTGILQFVLAWFILLLVLVCEGVLLSRGQDVVWDSGTSLVLVFTTVFVGTAIWQYAQRRTTVARVVLLAFIGGFLPAMTEAWRLPFFHPAAPTLPHFPKGFDIGISFDLARAIPSATTWQRPPEGSVVARIPLAVAGLPPNTLLRGRALTTIKVDGRTWPDPKQMWVGQVDRIDGDYWEVLTLEKRRFSALQQSPANVHAAFTFEVVNDAVERRIALTQSSFLAPNLGFCRIFSGTVQTSLSCRTGLAATVETAVNYTFPPGMGQGSAATEEYTLPWGSSPTTNSLTVTFNREQAPAELTLIPRRKVTEFQRSLDAPNIELSRYLLPSVPAWPPRTF